MLSTLADYIQEDNFKYRDVYLQIDKGNEDAIKLYTSLGFKIEGEDSKQYHHMSCQSRTFASFSI